MHLVVHRRSRRVCLAGGHRGRDSPVLRRASRARVAVSVVNRLGCRVRDGSSGNESSPSSWLGSSSHRSRVRASIPRALGQFSVLLLKTLVDACS